MHLGMDGHTAFFKMGVQAPSSHAKPLCTFSPYMGHKIYYFKEQRGINKAGEHWETNQQHIFVFHRRKQVIQMGVSK